jgi:SAM-dependent MidA family methyltransferase
MRRQQEATLRDCTVPIEWSASLGDLPKGIPTILIANEYLDTLPVDQWVWAEGEWRARRIGVGADGAFEFVLGAGEPGVEELASRCPPPPDGAVLEARKFSELASCIGALIREAPAAGLFMDYGHVDCQFGDSLQAVRGQRYEHPLASPGEADVTCQVDFVDFGLQFRHHEITVDGPVAQAEFLGSLGISERASRLMAANPDKAAAIEAAIARLMAPAGMGSRFKAIGVRSSRLPQLPGFAAAN